MGSGGAVSYPCRIGAKENHKDRLDMVIHLVDAVLNIEWGRVARTTCPLSWAFSRKKALSLLCDAAVLDPICAARDTDDWAVECHTDITALLDSSSHQVLHRLFSASLSGMLNGKPGMLTLDNIDTCVETVMAQVWAVPGCIPLPSRPPTTTTTTLTPLPPNCVCLKLCCVNVLLLLCWWVVVVMA